MGEQIVAEWGNYVGWNVTAIVLVLVAAKWPKLARGLFSVLFLGAGAWNLFASLTMPAFYVATYGPVATPPYAAFIRGPFAANPALFVVPIATGQLAIGILAAYLLYRTPFDTSLFEDVGATAAATTRTFQPRGRARPHR